MFADALQGHNGGARCGSRKPRSSHHDLFGKGRSPKSNNVHVRNAILWGLPDLLQYYMGGGVCRDPQIVLRNI